MFLYSKISSIFPLSINWQNYLDQKDRINRIEREIEGEREIEREIEGEKERDRELNRYQKGERKSKR